MSATKRFFQFLEFNQGASASRVKNQREGATKKEDRWRLLVLLFRSLL